MWYCPEKYKTDLPDVNKQFRDIEGDLEEKEAKVSLAKFLHANLGITAELISGIKLATYQEITLRALMNRNFSMCVWGRGCGKTFIASVFCFLQCIFYPGTKILIAGPTFRTARFIFNNLETMVNTKGADLLAQCFGAKIKRNDQFEWQINGGTITAIPLNGEKIRGFRANVLVLDEFLLLPEDIIKTVLMPFLVAPQNMKERMEIREIEDKMIERGDLKEEERMVFENTTKMIALSSASYTFENLYTTFKEWSDKIYDEKLLGKTKYFISQMGYEALPDHMIDRTIIGEAESGGQSHSSFQREYCALFTDGSDSYFSAKKMHESTIPDGETPTTKIIGDTNKKYIVGIDPSFSNSPSSDFFAIAVIELDEENKQGILVHNYAVAGGNLKDHIKYFYHIMTNFDVEMVIIDNAGFQFIDSCNENSLFRKNKTNLKFFNFESDAEGIDYDKMVKKARNEYNKINGKICFKQVFTTDFIRKANEHLQANIDWKRIWFASRVSANGSEFDKYSSQKINLNLVKEATIGDFIETQDLLLYQVKRQCALVEVSSTARGSQTFDLPLHLRRDTSIHRARKDNYTTLMLGNWAVRCYFDMMNAPKEEEATFAPRML